MDEKEITRILRQDLSVGTEAFRDNLLARCIAELGTDDYAIELDDADLELLSAAGDISAQIGTDQTGPEWITCR